MDSIRTSRPFARPSETPAPTISCGGAGMSPTASCAIYTVAPWRWRSVPRTEGLGFPAVEAARCGTPVLATTESPLPQLLEGGGIFVNPGDASVIESALE